MTEARAYVLGTGATEQARLMRQAAGLEAEARSLLDRVGIQPGWRALDVGCGPVGILDLLAARMGGAGVVGLERETRLLEMARQMVADRGLANVRLVAGDATATGLREAFDLVHERLLLINSLAPERIVAEMAERSPMRQTDALAPAGTTERCAQPGSRAGATCLVHHRWG